MNTPAHVVLNLLALARGRGRTPRAFSAIAAGAILPDLPMVLFYAVQRGLLATPERIIWGRVYFEVGWQNFFDVFNSLPLIAIAAAYAWGRQRWTWLFLLASMALHTLFDLPLHHDDGHRHLFPFAEWRFASPISYWDPAHHGQLVGSLEIVLVVLGSAWLWKRHPAHSSRALIGLVAGSYLAFAGYAVGVWL